MSSTLTSSQAASLYSFAVGSIPAAMAARKMIWEFNRGESVDGKYETPTQSDPIMYTK